MEHYSRIHSAQETRQSQEGRCRIVGLAELLKRQYPHSPSSLNYDTFAVGAVSNRPSRSAAQMRNAYLLRISLLASRKSTSNPGASSSNARMISALFGSGRAPLLKGCGPIQWR